MTVKMAQSSMPMTTESRCRAFWRQLAAILGASLPYRLEPDGMCGVDMMNLGNDALGT